MRELTNADINWIDSEMEAYEQELSEKFDLYEAEQLDEFQANHDDDEAYDLDQVKAEIHEQAEQEKQEQLEDYRTHLEYCAFFDSVAEDMGSLLDELAQNTDLDLLEKAAKEFCGVSLIPFPKNRAVEIMKDFINELRDSD